MAIGKNSLRGIEHDEFHYPFLVSGGVAVTASDVGQAVMLDSAAANTVKLATDGASILGYLVSYEDRKTEGTVNGAVALFGGHRFTIGPNALSTGPDETPVIGQFLVGDIATTGSKGGYVRLATDAELATGKIKLWQVVEVEGTGQAGATVIAIAI